MPEGVHASCVASHMPTAEDPAADLASRHSDAISSTAPAQVCLPGPLILLGMLCCMQLPGLAMPCFAVHVMLCCTMSLEYSQPG